VCSSDLQMEAAPMTDLGQQFSVVDRVAVVTGGGQGIGREIVRVLAAGGAHVAIADLNPATAADAAREVEAMGRRGLAVTTDVADNASVEAMTSAVLAAFGRVDILVNDAGICINKPALETSPEEWLRIIGINLNGVYWCSRAVGRHMVERRSGVIVNIASMSGSIVNWPQPQAGYNASKAGVIHLTKSLASEWAEAGVRVNSVSPGYIGTEMTKLGMSTPGWGETWLAMSPMKRLGEPVDVANAVLYLASDAAAFATGTNLIVDGGYTVW
jgi:NAD(P)-dependent dehydrogenase (short-subunit alcohol dehydrogenase family)